MSKVFVFPLDKKKFNSKQAMYEYIERTYPHMLTNGITPARLYFNLKYNKTQGKCVMTGKPTAWNEATERYERFADEAAKEAYREMFKRRMKAKYGKTHILDDPEQQKKMLEKRSISLDYKWKDGRTSKVNSKLELDLLNFLEDTYGFNKDCITEPPTIYYKLDEGTSSFYLPDFYIPSLNLIIEVKGTNPHYQQRDSYKESLKAKATVKEGFEFIQVNDKNYIEIHKFFIKNVFMK